MVNVKSYRVKIKPVTAMKTYVGQPLNEIRDFMIGCKNISFVVGDYCEVFNTSIEGSGGVRELAPGDYIVMSEDRNAVYMSPTEFEERYEVDDLPQTEAGLAYALVKIYGYSVKAAFEAVASKTIRDFLIASLKDNATSHLKECKVDNHIEVKTGDFELGKILNGVSKSMEEEIKRSKRPLQ